MSIVSNGDKSTGRSDGEVRAMYEAWLVEHGKNYNGLGEKEKRFEIFKDNLRSIDEHNAQNLSWKKGLNQFADLTNEEFRSRYLGGCVRHSDSDSDLTNDGELLYYAFFFFSNFF